MPLATYTVTGSPDSSVEFSSIPATYRDLVLVMNCKIGASAEALFMQFNSDTGNNYHYVVASGDGSATGSFAVGSTIGTRIGSIYTNDGSFYGHIMDYSATDKHKTVLGRASTAANIVQMTASRWANNNAITSCRVFPDGGQSFAVGSTFSLYGIAS